MGTIDIIYKKDSEALLWGVPRPQKEIRTSLLPHFTARESQVYSLELLAGNTLGEVVES